MTPMTTQGLFKRTALGAAIFTAALVSVSFTGCGGGSTVDSSSLSAPVPVLPAEGEFSRAQFVGQVSDYLGWYHASGYNDYWKVPLRTFSDVKASDQYGKQVENAYEENIIAPDGNGKFYPQYIMTRQDAAVIMAKAFFLTPASDTSALSAFTDAGSISEAAKPSGSSGKMGGFLPGSDYL